MSSALFESLVKKEQKSRGKLRPYLCIQIKRKLGRAYRLSCRKPNSKSRTFKLFEGSIRSLEALLQTWWRLLRLPAVCALQPLVPEQVNHKYLLKTYRVISE
jgi:hypothetical protein